MSRLSERAQSSGILFLSGLFVLGLLHLGINAMFWKHPTAYALLDDISHSSIFFHRLDALVYASGGEAVILAYITYHKSAYSRHVHGDDSLSSEWTDSIVSISLATASILLAFLNLFAFPDGDWWVLPEQFSPLAIPVSLLGLSICLVAAFGLAIRAHSQYKDARRTERDREHNIRNRIYQ